MSEKEIRIDGLTEHQVRMLDAMWSISSSEEFDEWYENLCEEEMRMADQLKDVLVYAVMDAMAEQEEKELADVRNYLKKFQLKK